ncbi:hypothetical protein HPB47_002211 [Ixodes persulcatus]|uniref:Uncharacterized protein n=1 Tax=Ixodes persulcatus TaxID=34615 RepID=A0AC60PLV0_IXOPE|nr:hypothetical protein HPB47_002211 [Ixodes persulcatus]
MWFRRNLKGNECFETGRKMRSKRFDAGRATALDSVAPNALWGGICVSLPRLRHRRGGSFPKVGPMLDWMEVAGLGFVYPTGNRLHPRWPSRKAGLHSTQLNALSLPAGLEKKPQDAKKQLFPKESYLKDLEAQIREKKERMLKEKEEEVRPVETSSDIMPSKARSESNLLGNGRQIGDVSVLVPELHLLLGRRADVDAVPPRLSSKVLREALPPDVYSQELQKQIEEKKQRDEEQRLKDAAEEEKLEKRVEEQRLKMYQEYNEERKRGKGKDLQNCTWRQRAHKETLEKCATSVKVVYKDMNFGNPGNIGVSFDGTWHTRGHSSRVGVATVIELFSGYVLDYVVSSHFCLGCECGPEPGSSECAKWEAQHLCQKNTECKAGQMEVDAALILLQHSLSLHGLRYTTMLCDGDSRSYHGVAEAKVYGFTEVEKEDCTNHVRKRMGTALHKLVQKHKSDNGGCISGKGRLTGDLITKLAMETVVAEAIMRFNLGKQQATSSILRELHLNQSSKSSQRAAEKGCPRTLRAG